MPLNTDVWAATIWGPEWRQKVILGVRCVFVRRRDEGQTQGFQGGGIIVGTTPIFFGELGISGESGKNIDYHQSKLG